MHGYGDTNAPWAVDGLLAMNGSNVAKFRRGTEISTKHYPMEPLEELQIPGRLCSDTEARLDMEGEIILLLKTGPVILLTNGMRTYDWNITTIRRYGFTSTTFHFEVGRRSKTGQGVFTFLTDKGKRIHQKITEMKSYFQFDLFCQKGMSSEQIINQALGDQLGQSNSTLGRRYTLRNKSSTLRSFQHDNNYMASQSSSSSLRFNWRSISHPVLNTSTQTSVTRAVSLTTTTPSREAQTLPRRHSTVHYAKDDQLHTRTNTIKVAAPEPRF